MVWLTALIDALVRLQCLLPKPEWRPAVRNRSLPERLPRVDSKCRGRPTRTYVTPSKVRPPS
jgi:hypothetical protein